MRYLNPFIFFQLIEEPLDNFTHVTTKLINSDMRYDTLTKNEEKRIILEILKSLEVNNFSTTGDKSKWQKGWKEVFNEYSRTKDVSSLSAKFTTTRKEELILRLHGEYIHTYNHDFHKNLYTAFHYWAIEKYFKDATEIFDFGCGTGENIKHIADILPKTKLHGLDWVQESVDIVNLLKTNLDIDATGHQFDFFNPDYSLDIPEGSAVYTSESLEQVGSNFRPFLNFLLEKKPSIVVNFEPILEFYDDTLLLDYLAIKYHTQRNYLIGYYTELKKLENNGYIQILKEKRLQYGGLNHDSSIIVWKPI